MVVISLVRWNYVHQLITSTGASHCSADHSCLVDYPTYRLGYRPGAADPPFRGGGREVLETWSRCNIYYMLCMICVDIYKTICLCPLI